MGSKTAADATYSDTADSGRSECGDRALADGRLMAKLYYRGMAEEDGKPKVGRSARLLGVRLGIDIDVEQMLSQA